MKKRIIRNIIIFFIASFAISVTFLPVLADIEDDLGDVYDDDDGDGDSEYYNHEETDDEDEVDSDEHHEDDEIDFDNDDLDDIFYEDLTLQKNQNNNINDGENEKVDLMDILIYLGLICIILPIILVYLHYKRKV